MGGRRLRRYVRGSAKGYERTVENELALRRTSRGGDDDGVLSER